MRSRTKLPRAICLSAAMTLLAVSSAYGQAVLGTIQGTVVDTSNKDPLPGVLVVVRNAETGADRETATNARGFYAVRALPSGVYTVTASLEGMQTVRRENVRLLVGQVLDVNVEMSLEAAEEEIFVTSEAPLIEESRSSAASYVSEVEIEQLPISSRDFKEFTFLSPTVQDDPVRGFITMSGQRGIYTGLNIDGTSAKSAFFGYGRGGEATENDGLVVAQESVKEFQVTTSGFAPEYGANAGGYVNVVTKSGTNVYKGKAFYFFRDDSLVSDIPSTPLDEFRGRDTSREPDEFERLNWGLTVGGPIVKDRTHFFFSYDQLDQDTPFTRTIDTPGLFDLVLEASQNIPGLERLLDGFEKNPDGTATGLFNRAVDNVILFGKVDHEFNRSHTGTFRVNYTDFERESTFRDEESAKLEDTTSFVASVVSLFGGNALNEGRIQIAEDNLDRLSKRVGEPVEAQIRFRFGEGDSLGKFDFLPIFVEESKLQVQDSYSYLFGDHDLKFGVDYQKDDLAQLFAGSLDGRYDFNSAEDFLANRASNVRIFFGDVTFPNYDETQEILGAYAQDSWRVSDSLTLNYGIRYNATFNPDGLEHIFPEGREIPDDTDNWAPRFGFAYLLPGERTQLIRGGAGVFYGRTPSLLFASQVQQNGLFPNFGRVNVQPGDIGFVPLGQPIDNENPPADSPNSPAFVDPSFEDPQTTRFNFGYEREVGDGWTANVDLVYAEGINLQSNVELNRTFTLDEFGRPIYSPVRPDPEFNEIFTRQSIGMSNYKAATIGIEKRFAGRYQLQAHYTWSRDKDTDSNERSATGVTVSNPEDVGYDWGRAERDVENRLVVSGLARLPYGFTVAGIVDFHSGRPFDPTDASFDFVACGFFALGFNCPNARPVDENGNVLERNAFRNESVEVVDLRVGKNFRWGKYDVDLFAEVFNLFDEHSFEVPFGFTGDNQRDPSSEIFGIPSFRITPLRQWQLGVRLTFGGTQFR